MSVIEAILLGMVQGLTEFLPVSSSGHLELAKALLGDESLPAESLLFTVVLHFATALSTVVFFRRDLLQILRGLLQFKDNDEWRFSLRIVVSMVPAALVGLLFLEQLELLFSGQIVFVGFMLLVTGALLQVADRARATTQGLTIKSALLIGVAQAVAILPGISRSGATISTSVLLGIDREKAARFSFLMVVPLIFSKMANDALSGDLMATETPIFPMVAGSLAAFACGLIACRWMISLVKKSRLRYFGFYCFAAGAVAIAAGLMN